MNTVLHTLKSAIASVEIRDWSAIAPQQQQQLQRSTRDPEQLFWISPSTVEELSAIVACANRNGWRVLPCGRTSKLHWGGIADRVTLVISTERLTSLVDHAVGDLTVTAEAGIGFAQLQGIVGKSGQFCAIDPSFRDRATLGGIIATADTGSLRHRYNSIRDMLLGISFVRSDGEIVKAGGRVVKNVAGYDLMKLFTGSYGTLGIITQATLRVYPQAQASQTVGLSGDLDALAQAMQTVLNSALTPVSIDLISAPIAQALNISEQISLIVRFQSIAESVEQQVTRLTEVATALSLKTTIADDADLWLRLPELIDAANTEDTIACKIGVKPTEAISVLNQFAVISPEAIAIIHAGSGIGRFSAGEIQLAQLQNLRSICEAAGGYLSILQAPIALKQQLDVWGYAGNALELMKRIKTQFDPQTLFSPHRFVGGI